ncbi:two-component sensor histidine kinase BarA [Pseudoalteromonas denitrificans]|nr:two-component sensor histidine kinase BarA [Pseudoalteromonas denitrificans]
MTKLGLREWVLLLTLVPAMIIGLILGSYFTINRYLELNDFLIDQGTNIAEPLAIAAENALINKDKKTLNRLISHSHNKHSPLIKSIAIFDDENKLIVTSNFHRHFSQLKQNKKTEYHKNTSTTFYDTYIVFHTPIFDHSAPFNSLTLTEALPIIGFIAVQINKDQAIMEKQKSIILSIFVILLTLLFALISAFKLSQFLAKPLGKIVFAIDQLKEGKQDIAIEQPMSGEFELIRHGLNDISRNMIVQKDEMQKHIDQAISDYRETLEQYETQNIQLNIAKQEAQDANRVKSDFLAKMSHELRTPLNGVIGFTRQLYKTPLNKNQIDYLDTIELSANSLLSIISDILDFSKLEAGAMELEKIHFQLRDTVNEVLTLLAPSAHEKSLELSIYIQNTVPENLIGDPTRFKQILINLISNAIKFTETGSVTIDIECRIFDIKHTSLLVSVKDTGHGISSDKQDSLFMAFGQADSSITRKFGGTGLGLIITKHLVEAMNGGISLNSALGKGSCFTFNALFELPEHNYIEILPIESLKQKRVLYYESHEHSFDATLSILKSWHVQVEACRTINELESALKQEFNFDISIIGHSASPDTIKDIRTLVSMTREHTDYLYLMVNTVSHNMREALVTIGADACLSKPVNHKKLCETLAAPYRLDHPTIHTPTPKEQILPLKALVVDDNAANLKLICTLLNEQIETLDTAHNGAQALSLAKSRKYDLIFLDIQMPIMDGITACKMILDSSLNEDTPIIAVTAHALVSEKEHLLKTGFRGYLTKPLDEDMLRQAIHEYGEHNTPSNKPSTSKSKKPKQQINSSEAPFQSHVIDWPLALERAGGKSALAHEMLHMLMTSIPETQKKLEQAYIDKKREDILQVIHKFHGACCYTGVPKLKQLAETLEISLKKGAKIQDIEPELFEFQDELINLLSDANVTEA